jgi:hypothetical protein
MTFRGWGTSLAWWANIDYDDFTKNLICDLLFDKANLGLNIVRYNIGGGTDSNNPDLHMRRGGMVPCLKDNGSKYIDLKNDKIQIDILSESIKRGVDTVELFVNSPPWWMTKNKKTYCDRPGISNLSSENYTEYAQFLSDVYNYFIKLFPVCSIDPFNEPSNPFWTYNRTQEGCYFSWFSRRKIIKKLKAINNNINISSSDSFSVGFALLWELWSPKKLINQVNVHSYKLNYKKWTLYLDDCNIIRKIFRMFVKKNIWISEYGCGESNNFGKCLEFGKHIIRDLKTLSPEAWIYWQAVETYNAWGLIEYDLNNTNKSEIIVTKKYWTFMHFTKTLNRGDQYKVIDNSTLYIYNEKLDKHAYIIINDSLKTISFKPHKNNLCLDYFIQTSQFYNYKKLKITTIFPNTITSIYFTKN